MQPAVIIKAFWFYLKVNLTMQENTKPRIEVFYVLEISKYLKTLQGSSGSRFADSFLFNMCFCCHSDCFVCEVAGFHVILEEQVLL